MWNANELKNAHESHENEKLFLSIKDLLFLKPEKSMIWYQWTRETFHTLFLLLKLFYTFFLLFPPSFYCFHSFKLGLEKHMHTNEILQDIVLRME